MQRNLRRRRRRGFTLMEVLLVLAILVILGSLVGVSIFQMQKNANIRAAKAQIGMFEQALTTYQVDMGSYPSAQQGLAALLEVPTDARNANKWAGPYLQKAVPPDPWGNSFTYDLPSADHPHLTSPGPDGRRGRRTIFRIKGLSCNDATASHSSS